MPDPTPPTTNRFLSALSPDDLRLIEPSLVPVELTLGAVINMPDSGVDAVLFPMGAILSVITEMEDGRGVESNTIGRESAYGILNALGARTASARVIAQVPGPALRLPSGVFKAATVASTSFLTLTMLHAQAQASMTEQSAACNALHQVEARLCRWLLLSQDRSGASILPLTQEFLSFMLGVQRTTVTAAARSLHSAGLIRYSRGRLELLDRAGLEQGACECYAAVNRRTDELLGAEAASPLPRATIGDSHRIDST